MNGKIKVVFDTNILVSALWSDNGNASLLISKVPEIIRPCICAEMLLEYTEVLNRPKFGFSEKAKKRIVTLMWKYGQTVIPEKSNMLFRDESDRVFYDVTTSCGAILVTGNSKHYPIEPRIMSPRALLELIDCYWR